MFELYDIRPIPNSSSKTTLEKRETRKDVSHQHRRDTRHAVVAIRLGSEAKVATKHLEALRRSPGSLCAGTSQTEYTLAHTSSGVGRGRCIQLSTLYTCMAVNRPAKIRFHVLALSVPVQRPGDGKSLSASEV